MSDEKIIHYCCCCGARLPSDKTAYELVQIGCGVSMGDGSILTFCSGSKHSNEDIRNAMKFVPTFRRASEERK
jgi:hypothetical protein